MPDFESSRKNPKVRAREVSGRLSRLGVSVRLVVGFAVPIRLPAVAGASGRAPCRFPAVCAGDPARSCSTLRGEPVVTGHSAQFRFVNVPRPVRHVTGSLVGVLCRQSSQDDRGRQASAPDAGGDPAHGKRSGVVWGAWTSGRRSPQ